MTSVPFCTLIVAAALVSRPVPAQEHPHSHGAGEELGTVRFPTSCRPEVAAEFTRGVALLHSFEFEEARRSFESVAQKDPACAMAHWGVAMTYYHPIWAPPSRDELASGRAAAAKAEGLGGRTDRERGYIAAIGGFFAESGDRGHGARASAYGRDMESLSRRFPDDHEAAIFHAVALLGAAPASDAAFVNQKKAAAILNALMPLEPSHPGIAHYMIHSFDYPQLANDALPAARAYAKIAPSSPHALHMPSHIFTRLGLWRESIGSNLASADAGRKKAAKRYPGAAAYETLHALDYLEYAYLQIDDPDRAQGVRAEAAAAKTFDEATFSAGYALAAIPARWALERRDWKAAAELEAPSQSLPWERFPYALAITPFAQAVGAARTGRVDRARESLGRIEKVRDGLVRSPVPGPYDWAAQVESMRLAAAAWIAYADGRKDEAVTLARSAADLEDKTGKSPVTPGALLPARELLGDMLLEMGRASEALAEYEAALRQAPHRFNGLYGAARAAESSGDRERARVFYGKLAEQCVPGSRRPEIEAARRYLAAK